MALFIRHVHQQADLGYYRYSLVTQRGRFHICAQLDNAANVVLLLHCSLPGTVDKIIRGGFEDKLNDPKRMLYGYCLFVFAKEKEKEKFSCQVKHVLNPCIPRTRASNVHPSL